MYLPNGEIFMLHGIIFALLFHQVLFAERMGLYELLGVDKKATVVEIKQAYRRASLKYHPDANSDQVSKQMTVEVNFAKEVLLNAEKRSLYDQFGFAGVEKRRKATKSEPKLTLSDFEKKIMATVKSNASYSKDPYAALFQVLDHELSWLVNADEKIRRLLVINAEVFFKQFIEEHPSNDGLKSVLALLLKYDGTSMNGLQKTTTYVSVLMTKRARTKQEFLEGFAYYLLSQEDRLDDRNKVQQDISKFAKEYQRRFQSSSDSLAIIEDLFAMQIFRVLHDSSTIHKISVGFLRNIAGLLDGVPLERSLSVWVGLVNVSADLGNHEVYDTLKEDIVRLVDSDPLIRSAVYEPKKGFFSSLFSGWKAKEKVVCSDLLIQQIRTILVAK
jgi:hypothetical protein